MKGDLRCISRADLDAARYDAFVAASPTGSPFQLSAWLDAVATPWQLWVVADGQDRWHMAWPDVARRKHRMPYSTQPNYLHTLGPVVAPELLQPARLSKLHETLGVVAQTFTTRYVKVAQSLSPGLPYSAALHEAGFALTTRYTFRYAPYPEATDGPAQQLAGYHRSRRRSVKLALEAGFYGEPVTPHDVLRIHQQRLQEPGFLRASTYRSLETLLQTDIAPATWQLDGIRSADGALQAVAAGVRLGQIEWALAESRDAQASPKQDAMALLHHERLNRVLGAGCTLDYAGSMMPGVAQLLRSVGAKPVPYVFAQYRARGLAQWLKRVSG